MTDDFKSIKASFIKGIYYLISSIAKQVLSETLPYIRSAIARHNVL